MNHTTVHPRRSRFWSHQDQYLFRIMIDVWEHWPLEWSIHPLVADQLHWYQSSRIWLILHDVLKVLNKHNGDFGFLSEGKFTCWSLASHRSWIGFLEKIRFERIPKKIQTDLWEKDFCGILSLMNMNETSKFRFDNTNRSINTQNKRSKTKKKKDSLD